MPDTNSIILAVAAFLFVIALVALAIWAFKSFVLGGAARSGPGFLRQRDRRLGVVQTAVVDGRRKLMLVRRDDIEHLIMIGGPVDVLIETGIQGRRHLEPPLEDVIIARSDTRPAPDYGKG
jgi:flagellar protein FliO/FliZ